MPFAEEQPLACGYMSMDCQQHQIANSNAVLIFLLNFVLKISKTESPSSSDFHSMVIALHEESCFQSDLPQP